MHKKGFSLTDILLTMVIIGVVFSMTLPVLNKNSNDKELISRLNKFNSTLEDAIEKWKSDNNCHYKMGECFDLQKSLILKNPDFDQIKEYLNIAQQIDKNSNDINYLPEKTLNYYGTQKSDYDFRSDKKNNIYLLLNGTTFSVNPDAEGFWILVDVNGKRPPNRIGKDTFHLTVGYDTKNDINYYPREKTTDGLCGHGYDGKIKCDPENINPTVGNGASPTAYILLNGKLPDFKSLSKIVLNFMP